MSNRLSETLKAQVLSMPEYRQGINKIRVRLRDGRVFSNVFVAWGDEIVKVGASESIPFIGADVLSVENDI